MAQLFHRTCNVLVDNLRIDRLRMQFKATKTLQKEPNTLDLKITNVSERNRSQMQAKGSRIVLTAGYPQNAAVIFSGEARTIDHIRAGPDWVTHIQCGDGETVYQFARISESFAPGTAIADVIKACANELGINTGNLDEQLAAGNFRGSLTEFVHGYTAHGKASVELDTLLKSIGFAWSVQDGTLQILKGQDPAQGTAVLLTPETGLIGSPDHGTPDKKGKPSVLKIKALLQPQIKCGGKVEVRAEGVRGLFRAEKVEHSGDTSAGDWYTNIEARAATP